VSANSQDNPISKYELIYVTVTGILSFYHF